MSISLMTMEGKIAVVTRDHEVQVIVPVGKVRVVAVTASNGKFINRWFHDLTTAADQHHGLGYMRKKDAIDAVMAIVRAQGWLPE